MPKNGVIDLSPILKPADPDNLGPAPDNFEALQAVLDGLNSRRFAGAKLLFPPGIFRIRRPIEISTAGVTLEGAGPSLTRLIGPGGFPCFAAHTACPRTVDPATRPEAFGVLDRSIAPTPGRWAGYSSLGRYCAISSGNATTMGRQLPGAGGGVTDYYRTWSGITFEIALAEIPQSGTRIVGHSLEARAGIWSLYVDSLNQLVFAFTLHEPGTVRPVELSRAIVTQVGTLPKRDVYRFRWSVDFDRGIWEATESGTPLKSFLNGGPTIGLRLLPNYQELPLMLGHDGWNVDPSNAHPPLKIWGMKLTDRFKPEPPNDNGRYGHSWEDKLVWMFDGRDTTPRRYLPLYAGDLWAWRQMAAWLVTDGANRFGVNEGLNVRGIAFQSFAPAILIGTTIDVRIDHCETTDCTQFVASGRVGAAYDVQISDCEINVTDSAVSLVKTIGSMTRTNIRSVHGPIAVRTMATQFEWSHSKVWFPSGQNIHLYAGYGGDYGGGHTIVDVLVDDEDETCINQRSLVYVEESGYNPTRVRVEDLYCFNSRPDAVAVELVGIGSDQPNIPPPLVYVSGLTIGGHMKKFATIIGRWAGTIDTRGSLTDVIDMDPRASVNAKAKTDGKTDSGKI